MKERILLLGQWVLLPLALLSLALGIHAAMTDSHDLRFMLQTAQALVDRHDPYNSYVAAISYGAPYPRFIPFDTRYSPTYLPSSLIFFMPFLLLGWPVVKGLWLVANVAGGFASPFILRRLYFPVLPRRVAIVAGLLLLCTGPFGNTLGAGQFGPVTVFCLLAALAAEKSRHPRLAIALLAFSLVKYTLTGPLALLLFGRKCLSIVAGAATIHFALILCAALWLHTSPLGLLSGAAKVAGYNLYTGDLNYAAVLNYFGRNWAMAGTALSAIIIGATAILMIPYRLRDDLVALAYLSFAACLVVYHRDYDAVILIVPLCLALRWWMQATPLQPLERIGLLAMALTLFPLWYSLWWARLLHKAWNCAWSEALVEANWYVVMTAATVALGALFAVCWKLRDGATISPPP